MMRRIPVLRQMFIGAGCVILLSAICYLFLPYMDYRIVALLLLLVVSLLAVLFDILPVLVSAVLSALILNLFFYRAGAALQDQQRGKRLAVFHLHAGGAGECRAD
ncbi:MAG: DUF4118 domain-containing protein [Leadbetterella sp.]|nr:DUF4118 domain-containing protein [Leadbetterella sp.]